MADVERTHELCPLGSLRYPDFVKESSNICIEVISSDEVAVGNDNGCFISSIDLSKTNATPEELIQFRGKEISSICRSTEQPSLFFVTCEKSVHFFDRRLPLNKAINTFSENIDDINQVKCNQLGNIISSCDDAGECKIFDLKMKKLFRTLRKTHTNICSSVCFIPTMGDKIITGGLDSQMFIWDYKRVKVLQMVNTQNILETMGDNSVYMFNPPFVHSIDINASGKQLASGLGNGTLQIFDILKGNRVIAPSLLINHHSSLGISNVHYAGDADKPFLVSGGNDGMVNLWSFPKKTSKKQTIPVNKVCTEDEIASYLLTRYNTNSKVNFITSTVVNGKRYLFVADQTAAVKLLEVK